MGCSPPGSSVHGILQARIPVLLFSHSVMSDSLWPHGLQRARLPCPSLSPLELAQIHVHWVGDAINHFILLSSSPFAFSLSQHQGFSNESALHIRWPKDWSFSFSIIPSNEYSGLISFRTDQFDLLEVQGTLKSLLQHHSSKASVLRCWVFLMVNSHIHTWLLEKIIALTIWTFVSKVISYSRGSSWPKDWTCVSCISFIGRQFLYYCTTWEALSNIYFILI